MCGQFSVLIWAKLGTILADEAALKAFWGVKGAAGNKPCLCCGNVVSARSGLAESSGGVLVPHTCTDFSLVVPHTDESLWEYAERVAQPMPKMARERLGTSLGISQHPNSVLLDRSLWTFVKPSINVTVVKVLLIQPAS